MLYISDSVARIVGLCLALTAALLTVFAVEKLTYLLSLALKFHVELPRFLLLYVAILPDVADFILPVTVVTATYLIVLRKREGREFLILSSAGTGSGRLAAAALGAGLVTAGLCLVLAGFVKPAASFLFRVQYAQAVDSALSEGLPGGTFYKQGDTVMFVAADGEGFSKLMRVFGFKRDRLERIVVSDCADLHVKSGQVVSELCGARVYLFSAVTAGQDRTGSGDQPDAGCRICAPADDQLDVVSVEAARSTIAFEMGDLVGGTPDKHAKDLNLFELLRIADGRFVSESNVRLAMGYLLRSLTCMIAVAVALGAVAATARGTRAYAMAAAICVVVAALTLASSDVLIFGPLNSPAYFLLASASGVLVCAAAIYAATALLQQRLITPMFIRS